MDNENTTLKETILKAYFENGISKEEILKKHLIGADTLNFWIKERETEDGRVGKKPSEEPINYESEADDDFHIFLKKERFLLDIVICQTFFSSFLKIFEIFLESAESTEKTQ